LQFKKYVEVIVTPPVPYIIQLRQLLKKRLHVGAQNCSHALEGAFTGGISAAMLKDVGATYVILGHWDRRRRCGEGDDLIGEKLQVDSTTR
jgi:triosephosphate isomerase